jgi:hypothetical protein
MKPKDCPMVKERETHFAHITQPGLTYCPGTIPAPWWWIHAAENVGHRTENHIETGQKCNTCGAIPPAMEKFYEREKVRGTAR